MKTIVVFAAFLAVAFAFPQKRQIQEGEKEVVMIRNTPSNYVGGDNYKFGYELSDGQMREEDAHIEVQGPEKSVIRVRGSYAWYNPENGMTYQINYIADENGFQPQGAHLPVAPVAPVVPAAPVAPVLRSAPVATFLPAVIEGFEPQAPVVPVVPSASLAVSLPAAVQVEYQSDVTEAVQPASQAVSYIATDPVESVVPEVADTSFVPVEPIV